ncbi:smoothelin-like protein 1 isoform X2 [Coturnix japonica]|uniref:smoothelin-like protein 1 isoform X2 n=1 Tax=Coturnix japonica TaxID=93934 RepID=UPI00077757D2|nr:smoothelin-like protein 1 isoform X2 [Coturnix japonica]
MGWAGRRNAEGQKCNGIAWGGRHGGYFSDNPAAHSRSMESTTTDGAPTPNDTALGDLTQTSTGPTEGMVGGDSGESAAQEGQGEAGGDEGGAGGESAGDTRIGGEVEAEKNCGSEAKGEAVGDAVSEVSMAGDAGSEAKGEAVEDAVSEAKGEAAKDAVSEAKGEAAKDAVSEAKAAGDAVKEPTAGQAAEHEAEGQTRGSAVPQEDAELGPRPVAAGSSQGRQEPTWLQDEDDELWPEFPPCSPTEEATSPTSPTTPLSPTSPVSPTFPMSPTSPSSPVSPTSPTAGSTESSGGSESGVSAMGPRSRVPPRVAAVGRPRMSSRAHGRSAILEKFGGAATGPAPHLKRVGATGSVKAMLLEWCRARTRGYQHVDIQNFSGSWSSGLAFCALVHNFFPDAFDYGSLEPQDRRHNFTLAFTTAEERVDCAQLLEVDDMLRLAVPDSKCIYTYVQELYRSLVAKGLVKTKKR